MSSDNNEKTKATKASQQTILTHIIDCDAAPFVPAAAC
jgi:hypothetical protein